MLKKEQQKKENHRLVHKSWKERNPEKAKHSATMSNIKAKVKRHLKKQGKEGTKEVIDRTAHKAYKRRMQRQQAKE